MKKSKKSQIFILDFILAIVIVLVSLSLMYSYFSETRTNIKIYDLNRDIINSLSYTKINELNTPEVRVMFENKQIKNVDNTVLQQIGEFKLIGNTVQIPGDRLAQNLTKLIVKEFLERKDNINITLHDKNGNFLLILYNQTNGLTFDESELASVNKRKILGFTSGDKIDFNIEVKLWN